MNPIDFPERTRLYVKPEGWTDDQCGQLAVCEAADIEGHDVRISCWKPTWRERLAILFGKPIWLHVVFNAQPPVMLSTDCPFYRVRNDGRPS